MIRVTYFIVCLLLGITLVSCIRDEALNAEADILTCTVPGDILKRDPIIENNKVVLMLSLIHISEPTRRVVISYAVFCLKKFFFNDTATTEIYTRLVVGSVRCV